MGRQERDGVSAVGGPQWRVGERSESAQNGGPPTAAPAVRDDSLCPGEHPDPELNGKPQRRKFSGKYKLKILREADACRRPGQVGALLRREGLYSSHLVVWRRQREKGELEALGPKTRGRKPSDKDHPLAVENRRLRSENQVLTRRVRQAEAIIEVQKKVSEILGIPLRPEESAEED